MKAIKKKNKGWFAAAVAYALAAAAFFALANVNVGVLSSAGEKAAIFSAALNMPEGGLKLLTERFRAELYTPPQTDEPAHGYTYDAPPRHEIQNDASALDEPSPIPAADDVVTINPPRIPEKYKAALVSENFAGRDGRNLLKFGEGFIKNDTKKDDDEINAALKEDFNLRFKDTDEPQVLIFHTHATESFERYDSSAYDTRNTWRSTDNNNNMAAVGSAMQEILEQNGIGVIHDTTQHDYPSYNGSYERSAETVRQYLDEYPSIKVVLDLHRDAMEREDQVIVKPVAEIDGKKAAQVMIISGCDDGTMDMPEWPENLRFAAALQDKTGQLYPDLMRPVYLCYRKYNMDLSNGSLLLEFGSNANTLEEAVYSAKLIGEALSELIKENVTDE